MQVSDLSPVCITFIYINTITTIMGVDKWIKYE